MFAHNAELLVFSYDLWNQQVLLLHVLLQSCSGFTFTSFYFPGSKNYEIVATGLHAAIYRKGNILVYMLFQLGY